MRSKRRRRALAAQKLNHAIPAMGLLVVGLQAVREGETGLGLALGLLEILSSAALIVLTARELRSAIRPAAGAPHDHGHGVDWVDVAAGCMLVAEALEQWHARHHLARPTILTAIITFALAFSHGRRASSTAARRSIRVTDEGLAVPGRPFKVRKLRAAWSDLRSIALDDRWAVITTRSGRVRRVDLADAEEEPAVRAALVAAAERLRQTATAE